MNIFLRKTLLFITLLICGISIGLIIKDNPKGNELISSIIVSISSFLVGIGIWFGRDTTKK